MTGSGVSWQAIILTAILVFALFYAVRTILFLPVYVPLRKYLKSEIRRAETHAEHRHWKRELKKLYLCFLPFLNVNNIDGFYRFFRSKE